MPAPSIVIAQKNPSIAQGLAQDLHAHFARVAVAQSVLELRPLLERHQAQLAVLDLEVVTLEEIRKLVESYGQVAIVCTHRSPDERLWTAALEAGAVEFCHPLDIRTILRAARGGVRHRLAIAA
jgi:DNA-binding response OmpR family regulator